ncbi:MAG: hypothetical protein JWP12_1594 [Bacteroidetes bacterium]|nr:hypothetical protein [Bacteroidota bacterium]
MISPTANNRKIITAYLENLSEDNFIESIIIPLFSMNGYIVYRINMHGPGEHGKDIIFYKHVPLYFGNEYITVQAKAEKVTASNVSKFSHQLIRALRVPFSSKTNTGENYSNYVIFMNSKSHTNDANFEFPYLIDGKGNIKILQQSDIVELIISNSFVPDEIKDEIEQYVKSTNTDLEQDIRNLIYSYDFKAIRLLFDKQLKIEPKPLSNELKELLINYIFQKWDEDPTWEGTVEPMKWLNMYFDYIQEKQYSKLFRVFKEYSSSYHSNKAYGDTQEVVEKTTLEQVKIFQDELIELIVNKGDEADKHPLLMDKILLLKRNRMLNERNKAAFELILENKELNKQIRQLYDNDSLNEREGLLDKSETNRRKLLKLVFPDRSRRSI